MGGTLRDSWEKYERLVLPPDAPAVQRLETRRSFYCGAWTIICACFEIGEDDVTEEQGVNRLARLTEECKAFQKLVNEGKA